MTKRTVTAPTEEPTQLNLTKPSQGVIHTFQVVDFLDSNNSDIVICKCEVLGGEENGRSVRHRVDCNPEGPGFWATRLFLKAIKEPYKGTFDIDEDNWIGREFKSSVVHTPDKNNPDKTYANLDQYEYGEGDQGKLPPENRPVQLDENGNPVEWDADKT